MAYGPGRARGNRLILGIETTCDDTCAALVTRDGAIRANVIASQGLLHERYGGVVPEIASRQHLEVLDSVVDDTLERAGATLEDVEEVAVTRGPGLIGALLVGVSSAKALAASRRLPLVAVDHLHGHVTASMLGEDPIEPPYLVLVASGGHTFLARVDDPSEYRVLGETPGRCRRRGLRQGRAPARARLSRRPRDRPARARGRPVGVRLSALTARRRARLLVQRVEDVPALHGSGPSPMPTGPISPPPTSARSWTR